MLKLQKVYTRKLLKSNPNAIFIFGDNLIERGLGGQARECRGEPNAFGIPTKRFPTNNDNAFFSDNDFLKVKDLILKKFEHLELMLVAGKDIYWPLDGIGTGRAQLKEKAPQIFALIQTRFERLVNLSNQLEEQEDDKHISEDGSNSKPTGTSSDSISTQRESCSTRK